jgi:hypothetical protein
MVLEANQLIEVTPQRCGLTRMSRHVHISLSMPLPAYTCGSRMCELPDLGPECASDRIAGDMMRVPVVTLAVVSDDQVITFGAPGISHAGKTKCKPAGIRNWSHRVWLVEDLCIHDVGSIGREYHPGFLELLFTLVLITGQADDIPTMTGCGAKK